jgi:hypothetical protein
MHMFVKKVEDSINFGASWVADWLHLDPLGKIVNGHQNSIESP